MESIEEIMADEENMEVLAEFFKGVASGEYYDGSSYQLYLDLDNGKVFEHQEASSNSWLQRDDGSLRLVEQVNGYQDIPAEESYEDGCDLFDYGYAEWLDEISEKIKEYLIK